MRRVIHELLAPRGVILDDKSLQIRAKFISDLAHKNGVDGFENGNFVGL